MTRDELAARLDGREYGSEITDAEAAEALERRRAGGPAPEASNPLAPPHAVEPDEAPCRCTLERTRAGLVVRAVLDAHTADACREADGAPVAWPCGEP